MRSIAVSALALLFVPMTSIAAGAIGYSLIEEVQDGPTKTYSATFEVWSEGRTADSFTITPKTESKTLQLLTKKQVFKGPFRKGKILKHTVAAKNDTKETHPMTVTIVRKAGKRVDTKTVTILVPPQ